MKLTAALLHVFCLAPLVCWSQESDEEFNALVDQVLELTGAMSIGEQMGDFILAQMFEAVAAADTTVPDRAFDLIEEEVRSVLSEGMKSGSFQRLMYPVYARYLTKAHLEAMVAFYKTPEGQHIAEVLPEMTQEGMVAGQIWGQSLGPEIGRRVMERLTAEGIEIE